MSLDTITYSANGDGTFTKTVVSTQIVTDINSEIVTLQAQVAAFQADLNVPSADILNSAIKNYQQQITILQTPVLQQPSASVVS